MCKPNKNADPDKDKYSSYGIGSDSHSEFSLTDGSMRKNVITFEADVSSSVHIDNNDNKGKDILVLGEEPIQELDHTRLTTEAIYPTNFTEPNQRFALSLLIL